MIIQRNFKQINNLLTSKRFIWLIPVDSFLFKLNSTYPMESETNVVFDSFWLKIPAMGRKFLEKGRSSFFRWTIHSVKCVVYRLPFSLVKQSPSEVVVSLVQRHDGLCPEPDLEAVS